MAMIDFVRDDKADEHRLASRRLGSVERPQNLVTSIMIRSIRVALSARKEGRQISGSLWIVALVETTNGVAGWVLPLNEPFKAGLAVASFLGGAEGFAGWRLLGWWCKPLLRSVHGSGPDWCLRSS